MGRWGSYGVIFGSLGLVGDRWGSLGLVAVFSTTLKKFEKSYSFEGKLITDFRLEGGRLFEVGAYTGALI